MTAQCLYDFIEFGYIDFVVHIGFFCQFRCHIGHDGNDDYGMAALLCSPHKSYRQIANSGQQPYFFHVYLILILYNQKLISILYQKTTYPVITMPKYHKKRAARPSLTCPHTCSILGSPHNAPFGIAQEAQQMFHFFAAIQLLFHLSNSLSQIQARTIENAESFF